MFGDGTGADAYVGQITYKHSDNYMAFNTAGGEAMRIDSSGNLLVGTTDTDPSNNGANTSADDGVAITDGEIRLAKYQATANVGSVAYVNRTGSDGDILRLRKSGTTVGSIGTSAGRLGVNSERESFKFTTKRNNKSLCSVW